MKKILMFAAIAAFATSCTIALPGGATGNTASKTGTVEETVWFGLALSPIDLSIEAAAKSAGITKIDTYDHVVKAGLFKTTYKTVVTGS